MLRVPNYISKSLKEAKHKAGQASTENSYLFGILVVPDTWIAVFAHSYRRQNRLKTIGSLLCIQLLGKAPSVLIL